ncbi:MAG: flagellar basal body P-ring protein FlgI [Planctomycetota bacterium]|nr:flagellar basal body P-ring protein FlgI [Planctomycetota bacterium]
MPRAWAGIACWAVLLALCVGADIARATTVKDLTRIKGQEESMLSGVGLVTGLLNTGDDGKDATVARPLSNLLLSHGNATGSLKEIEKGKAVALVMVQCIIPEKGVLAGDKIDVRVSVLRSATSLKGGTLFVTPLRVAIPGGELIAFAEGPIVLDDPTTPTVGRVRDGARVMRDVRVGTFENEFDLILRPHFAGWSSATQVAQSVNAKADPQGPGVAKVIDDRTIRVTIPQAERANRANFLADVVSAEVNVDLMDLPAIVVANPGTGAIIVPSEVRIRPVVITHKDLTITTTIPTPQPSAQNPLVERSRWAAIGTGTRPAEQARLKDLLSALKQMDVPVGEQIQILQMLKKSGDLQAELVID